MSGFSDSWLALREPADAAARNAALEASLAVALPQEGEVRIVDLGAGTGANLRALAPRLGLRQAWVLLDWDTSLTGAARQRLAAFADHCEADGDALVLHLGDRRITVRFVTCDLAADPAAPFAHAPHLVTASAFYDLVSAEWCRRLAEAAARHGTRVHAALTCDGRDAWTPAHPADAAVLAAFRAHQGRDKGFGPAAGPEAPAVLARALEEAGYDVTLAASPWVLDEGRRDLIAALADGTAAAAAETGRVAQEVLAAWRSARMTTGHCVIGHTDLLALPKPGG